MKYFPKIKYVNVLPSEEIEQSLTNTQVLRGLFGGHRHYYTIHILNRKGKTITLLHELGHWLIEITFTDESDRWHKFYDKYDRLFKKLCQKICLITIRKEYKPQKWEQFQIDTRQKRCAAKFNEPVLFDF